jgi:hypothetical protein
MVSLWLIFCFNTSVASRDNFIFQASQSRYQKEESRDQLQTIQAFALPFAGNGNHCVRPDQKAGSLER